MVVGVLLVELYFPGANSLKSKRRELRSIKDRIRSKFNVSVSEVDNQDLWQRGSLGIAVAGSDVALVQETLGKIGNFLERNWAHLLLDLRSEIIRVL